MRKKTDDLSNNESPKIHGWPNGLADEIRAKATESNFDYFKHPRISAQDLERLLSEPSGIDPEIAEKHIHE